MRNDDRTPCELPEGVCNKYGQHPRITKVWRLREKVVPDKYRWLSLCVTAA